MKTGNKDEIHTQCSETNKIDYVLKLHEVEENNNNTHTHSQNPKKGVTTLTGKLGMS